MTSKTLASWRVSIRSDRGFRVVHILAPDRAEAEARVGLLDGERVEHVSPV